MALVHVEFNWSDEFGQCEVCGLPAAYDVIDAYGPGKDMRTCCVCAAQEASQGSEIKWLFEEDE